MSVPVHYKILILVEGSHLKFFTGRNIGQMIPAVAEYLSDVGIMPEGGYVDYYFDENAQTGQVFVSRMPKGNEVMGIEFVKKNPTISVGTIQEMEGEKPLSERLQEGEAVCPFCECTDHEIAVHGNYGSARLICGNCERSFIFTPNHKETIQ